MLGNVDPNMIKHENQTDIQHPVFAALLEQWEFFFQHLTNQKVRQFTVKTADDRLTSIWSLKIKAPKHSYAKLETTIEKLCNSREIVIIYYRKN
jgi:hypothetical protein